MKQNDIQKFALPSRDEVTQRMVLSIPNFAKPRGTVTVVKVVFLQASPYATTSDPEAQKIHASFAAIDDEILQGQIMALAMQPFQEVANVRFEMASSAEDADIRVGLYSDAGGDGGVALTTDGKKDVFLNLKGATAPSMMPGSEDAQNFMHEFGHALGLNHPSVLEKNPQGFFPDQYSSYRYSVESYNLFIDEFRWGRSLRPVTPMLFDLAGLDGIYGLRSSSKGGDDSYTVAANTGITIYDTHGLDTLSAKSSSQRAWIDLRSGHYSSINSGDEQKGNVAIWYDTAIENATGGNRDDILIGNELANVLDGGEGNDTLEGGAGSDTYQFSGKFGKDSIDESATKGGDEKGTIRINNIEIAPKGEMVGKYASGNGSLHTFKAKINGQAYTYTLKTSETSGDQLVIAKTGDAANTITLNHVNREALFSEEGYLGIRLDRTPKVVLSDELGDNPFTQNAGLDPASLSGEATLREHGAESFAIYLNQPAQAGDTITLALDGMEDKFQIVQGNSSMAAHGAVITLAEGQTQALFILVQEGTEVQSNGAAHLSATYQGQPQAGQAHGQTVTSNQWGIALKDGPPMYALQGGYFVPGGPKLPGGTWQFQSDGSVAGMAPIQDANDLMVGGQNESNGLYQRITGAYVDGEGNQRASYGDTGAVSFWGLGGNDFMSGEQFDDYLNGGDGDDLIWGGAGNDTIKGGAGNDIIVTNMAATHDTYQENPLAPGYVRGADTVFTYFGSETNFIGRWWVEKSEDGLHLKIPRAYVKNPDGGLTYWPEGENDRDTVDAGEGDDYVWGGRGADYLMGGAGEDHLTGVGGDDVILGGDGKDLIFGDEWGMMSLSTIYDHDRAWGYMASLPLDDALKSPTLHGDDVIDAGAGDDEVWGDGGNDVIFGSSGEDTLVGDALLDDLPIEHHGEDTLDGGDGNDQLIGMGKDDVLLGGAGNDQLQGDYVAMAGQFHGADVLDGGDGDDTLFGQGGADVLYGGAGNDQIEADDALDRLAGDFHGNDYVDGGDGNDNIAGGGGDDILLGGSGNDWIAGEDETEFDSVSTLTGNDQIFGGAGSDILVGGNGNDELSGDEDDDWLYGGAGDDRLDGGTGRNVLKGGAGNDTYEVATDGTHIIADFEGNNVVRGVDGLTLGTTLEGDLLLRSAARTVALTGALKGGFSGHLEVGGRDISVADYVLENMTDSISLGDDADDRHFSGGRGEDEFFANGANAQVRAGKGNDQITFKSMGGSVVLGRGDGRDVVRLAALPSDSAVATNRVNVQLGAGIVASDVSFEYDVSANVLRLKYSSEPDDILEVTYDGLVPPAVVDAPPIGEVRLADGTLLGLDFVPQRADEDAEFSYRVPSSALSGVGGSAAVSATLADGQPLPTWLHFDPASRTFSGTPDNDAVGGISVLVQAVEGNNSAMHAFALVVRNTNDAPKAGAILEAFSGDEDAAWVYDLPKGTFSDVDAGDVLTYTARLTDGSPLPSWLRINSETGQLSHMWGYAQATRLSVVITATDKAGAMAEQSFELTVRSSLDRYAILGTPSNDILLGSSGRDVLIGGAGDDVLDGGAGDDLLIGSNSAGGSRHLGEGRDTYLFGRGDGKDEIWNGQSEGGDILTFKSGIKPEDILVSRGDGSITVREPDGSWRLVPDAISFTIIDTGDKITVPNFHAAKGLGSGKLDFITFADYPSVKWDPEAVSRLALIGGSGNDDIWGYTSGDVVRGNAGNDRLWGQWGNDIYQFGKNDGKDVLYEFAKEGVDKIVFDEGILPADVVIVRSFDEINAYPQGVLVLRVISGSTEIRIPNFFQSEVESGIESIEFANGMVWGREYIRSNAQGASAEINQFIGSPLDDHYVFDHPQDSVIEQADAGLDSIESSVSYTLPDNVENLTLTGVLSINGTGNHENNVILGNIGDNILDWGGGGLDTLRGGKGSDIYQVLAPYELQYEWPYEDQSAAIKVKVIEDVGEGVDELRTNAFYAVLPENVEKLTIPSFVSRIISSNYSQKPIAKYFGNVGSNVIDASALNSGFIPIELNGGVGDDVLIGSASGYKDWAVYDDAQSRVQVSLSINEAQDTLAAGRDTLKNIENLRGSAHDDALFGNAQGNSIDGAAGSDRMEGGGGDDVYFVDNLGDVVIEKNEEGNDSVFLSGISDYLLPSNVEAVNASVSRGFAHLYINGNEDNNVIYANNPYGGDVVLKGLGGNDRISSNSGAYLDGGDGEDWLIGSSGADVFIGGRGSDNFEISASWGGIDIIKADPEVRESFELNTLHITNAVLEDLIFRRQELSLRIRTNSSDYVLIENFFDATGGVGERNPVQFIQTSGGSASGVRSIDVSEILARVSSNQAPTLSEPLEAVQAFDGQWFSWTIPYKAFLDDGLVLKYSAELENGNPLPEWLRFDESNGRLEGGVSANGSETLRVRVNATDEEGLSTSAILEIAVQVEDQLLEGSSADDVIIGGGGDDHLYGYEGKDQLQGGGGGDYIDGGLGDDAIFGEDGSDNIFGGRGSDFMSGGFGNDVFKYYKGDGQDTIDATDIKTAIDILQIYGVGPADIKLLKSGAHLFLLMPEGDQIALYNYFAADKDADGVVTDSKIDQINFESGDVWNQERISQILNAAASNRPPVINKGISPMQAVANKQFSYTIPVDTITDPDAGDKVTYSVTRQDGSTLPAWLVFNPATRTLSGTPTAAEAGSLSLVIWGTDGYGRATGLLASLSVSAGPTAPPGSYTYNQTMPNGQSGFTVSGNAPYNIKGNSGANSITGNDGPNVLNGAQGNDTLTGGKGGDTYFMEIGTGTDTIIENDSTAGTTDLLQWGAGVRHDQIWLRKSGNNLEVSIIGTSNKAIVKDWYLGADRHVEQIWADGKLLTDSKVQALVDAMAAFAPPAAGQTTLSASYQTALAPVIAANWQ